jgi:hypothetical protein
MGWLARSVVGLGLLLPLSVVAQPQPTENVTVTGTKSREVMQDFVRSMAVPTRTMDKLPRWNDGICPLAAGLHPAFAKFIVQRLREVAMQAGAPVNSKASCRPNIEIAFTAAPQTLMDHIKIKNSVLLGYYDNNAQRDQLAKVTHPIQAWYTTATEDLRGNKQVDGGRASGLGMEMVFRCNPANPDMVCTRYLSGHVANVTGERLGDGQRSAFYHVLIVVDPAQLQEYGMGHLSDYIAMLALTQVASLDACQQLPSIVNMLAKDCDRKSDGLTENDTAYLHGLYKMWPGRALRTQRDQIAYQMEQELMAGRSESQK